MKKAVRCMTNGVAPALGLPNSEGTNVVMLSPRKVHCFGRGLSVGRSKTMPTHASSSAKTGPASMEPSATQRLCQSEKSAYCKLSSGNCTASRLLAESREWSSRWKQPCDRKSKLMRWTQIITSTRPVGKTATSTRMDASSESLNGALPTSPSRASAADSSGTFTMHTVGVMVLILKLGGDKVAVVENTSWRLSIRRRQACTLRGLTPPAIHKELDMLYALQAGSPACLRSISSWPKDNGYAMPSVVHMLTFRIGGKSAIRVLPGASAQSSSSTPPLVTTSGR
mmetsp:Transcript_76406/g.169361  ORF Transcript_76406/g.169361 Transcript_76406/m.169361 type:complete len:283 (-) Transcript_76406:613-1461(-)